MLKADIESVLKLSTDTEQQQWINIKDYIELFQMGIDGSKPVQVEVLSGMTPVAMLVWVPLLPTADETKIADEFRDSLDVFGFETARDSQDRNLYQISGKEGAADYGWFRVIPEDKFGLFVLTTDKGDLQLLKQLILRATAPGKKELAILQNGVNLGAELVNAAIAPEDQAKRKSAFSEFRKISMDTIQKRPAESTTEFEIRQLAMKNQMDELERLMVEAAAIRILGTYRQATQDAAVAVTAEAIPESSLAESIALFGKQPCAFASVPKAEGSALSVRVNHPLDKMRQDNAVDFLGLIRKDLDSRINESKDSTDVEKDAIRKLLEGLLEITTDGIRTGYINAMVEAVPDGAGDFTTIAAISATNATRLNELLPVVGQMGSGNVIEMNVDKEGEIPIHRLQLAEGFVAMLDRIFGVKKDLFIGVDKERVWLASGKDAVAALKKTIAGLGEPVAVDTVIHVEASLLPWIKRLDDFARTEPEGKTLEEKEAQRSRIRARARAISALETDDHVVVHFDVKGGKISGEASFGKGAMRFVSKSMAAFSKENLE